MRVLGQILESVARHLNKRRLAIASSKSQSYTLYRIGLTNQSSSLVNTFPITRKHPKDCHTRLTKTPFAFPPLQSQTTALATLNFLSASRMTGVNFVSNLRGAGVNPASAVPQGRTMHTALKNFFGHSAFRPLQKDIVEAVLGGRDCLTVMATGSGKSLCYQLPPLVSGKPAVIISPLISLMQDQVRRRINPIVLLVKLILS